MTRDLCIQVYVFILLTKFWWDRMLFEEPRVSLCWLLILLPLLYCCCLLDSLYILSVVIPFFIHVLSCVDIICVIAVTVKYHSRFMACSDYLRLIAYMWGILLAYKHRQLSSRLRFSVFWEAGRDNNILPFLEVAMKNRAHCILVDFLSIL